MEIVEKIVKTITVILFLIVIISILGCIWSDDNWRLWIKIGLTSTIIFTVFNGWTKSFNEKT